MNRKTDGNGPFWAVVALAVVYTAAYRLVPAWVIPNLAPVGALAFFCGFLGRNPAYGLIPLGLMAATDTALYFTLGYPPYALVYLCLIAYTLLGWLASNKSFAVQAVSLGLSSLLFFLVTNFATWWAYRSPVDEMGGLGFVQKTSNLFLFELWYADSIYGLLTCYWMGLPFLGKTLIADFFFTGVFLALAKAFENAFAPKARQAQLEKVSAR